MAEQALTIPSEFVDYRIEGAHAVLLRANPIRALSRNEGSFEEDRARMAEQVFSQSTLETRIYDMERHPGHSGRRFDMTVEREALQALMARMRNDVR